MKTKTDKRRIALKSTYKKGVTYNDQGRKNVSKWVLQKGVEVHVINTGVMSDDSEFVTVRIEGIKYENKN